MHYSKKDSWEVIKNSPMFSVAGIPSLIGQIIRKRPPMAVLELQDGKECDVHISSLVRPDTGYKLVFK